MKLDIKLLLNEVPDKYSQENFKRIQRVLKQIELNFEKTATAGNTVVIQPLDGSVPITGVLEPANAGEFGIGSSAKPIGNLHANEVFLSGNSIFMDGQKVLGTDAFGRVEHSGGEDQDVVVRARGTGKLIIDAEGDIEINSSGNVTVNGRVVAAYAFEEEFFDIPYDITDGDKVVLAQVPLAKSERVILNGVELSRNSPGKERDYSIWQNVITFNAGVLTTDGLIKVAYNY